MASQSHSATRATWVEWATIWAGISMAAIIRRHWSMVGQRLLVIGHRKTGVAPSVVSAVKILFIRP
jgi:hypothetical protein